MNILFLTASTGGGHVKAAQALIEHLEGQDPGCRTSLVDSLKYINPAIDKLITGTYLHIIKSAPFIYGKFYDLSEKDESITEIVRRFNSILSHRLYRLFEQETPDAVVCTHTMPLQMMSHLKEKGLLSMPVLGIVTDYTNHYFWKLDEIDAFIVAHECIREDMVRMGIRGERIYTCGIPVSKHFLTDNCDRSSILKKIGLENLPTILIMGGSLGFSDMRLIFSSLLSLRRNIQIIAVAGYNEKLKLQLEEMANSCDKKIKVLGYTERIHELMSISSLIITKPGGITISEALVKRLPILIMRPIPGQEERNAKFLGSSGAACRLTRYEDLEAILANTLDKPFVLKSMSEAAGRLAKPNACEDIAGLVTRLAAGQSKTCCVSRS